MVDMIQVQFEKNIFKRGNPTPKTTEPEESRKVGERKVVGLLGFLGKKCRGKAGIPPQEGHGTDHTMKEQEDERA